MTTFTGGQVTYERTVRPADYESKKASVVLSFNVDEGQDIQAVLDDVSKLAMTQAHKMVGLATAASTPAGAKEPTKTKADLEAEQAAALKAKEAAGDPKARANKPPSPKKKETEKPAADAATVEEPEAKGQISTNPEDRKDPAAMGDDDLLSPGAEKAEAITDAAIVDAITQHNAKVKNAPEIRKLIGTYVTAPKTAKDIPVDKRAEFLEKLKEIKAAA